MSRSEECVVLAHREAGPDYHPTSSGLRNWASTWVDPRQNFASGPVLDLDVNEQELGRAVVSVQFGDDIGAPRASFGDVGEDLLARNCGRRGLKLSKRILWVTDGVGEDLLVEKLDAPKVDTSLDVREEELQKLLQKRLQKFLESLVVSLTIEFAPRLYRRETIQKPPAGEFNLHVGWVV